MESLSGKVAVVTGAASGIGRALATRFAAEGMAVVLADVEVPALERAEAELVAAGAEVLAAPTDVADASAVDALAARTVERFGAVHVVCNNAGVGGSFGGTTWETPLEEWAWVLSVNLWGVVHGIRAFVPRLVAQREGHVVNTASMAGLAAMPFMGPYTASKHAVVAITEALHNELGGAAASVGASVLCPGFVVTQIADSSRNRPDAYGGPMVIAPGDNPALDILRTMVEAGIGAEVVANAVVDAIRSPRFWVLTHDDFDDLLRARVSNIVEGRNPTSAVG